MVALQIVTWPELQRKRKQSVCTKEEIGWKKWIDKTRQSATPSKVTHDRAWKRNPMQCHTYTQRCNATTMEWTMQTNDFEQRNISLTWCEMGGDVEWNGMNGWTWNEIYQVNKRVNNSKNDLSPSLSNSNTWQWLQSHTLLVKSHPLPLSQFLFINVSSSCYVHKRWSLLSPHCWTNITRGQAKHKWY